MKITPEQVEFKEFAEGDYFFHNNSFYKKQQNREAIIVSDVDEDKVGIIKTFTSNCLVNIVLD